MNDKKILIVDDDVHLCSLASDFLEESSYKVLTANTTDEAFLRFFDGGPHLIVLDLWLPTIGGLEFCRQIRKDERGKNTPVLMLTVQDKESDKVMGLEMGADDYMTKPFSQKELLARIKALLRRYDRSQSDVVTLTHGDLKVDLQKHEVSVKSRVVELTPKEYELLILLLRGRNKAISRQSLLVGVWGPDSIGGTSTIDVHVRHLRAKLGPLGQQIKTVMGFGYRFNDE